MISKQSRRPAKAPKTPRPGQPTRASRTGRPIIALLDLLEERSGDAATSLAQRRKRYPETADLAYLVWVATVAQQDRQGTPAPIVATAGTGELREIFALARALGDRPTMQACYERERAGAEAKSP